MTNPEQKAAYLCGFLLFKGTENIRKFGIMAKIVKKKVPKPRASKYDPPVTFAGSFEQMIAISITGAGAKKISSKKQK